MRWDQLATRLFFFFFFNDTATTEIYTLSLHDALPISRMRRQRPALSQSPRRLREPLRRAALPSMPSHRRSEEHTSELQSHSDLVCRLLLEKKKKAKDYRDTNSHHFMYCDTTRLRGNGG